MSVQNPDTTAVNVESSTENEGGQVQDAGSKPQHQMHQNQQQNNHGGRRGGGRFSGGNYRSMKNENDFGGGRRRPRQGNIGGSGRDQGGDWTPDDRLMDRVAQISGPTYELPPVDTSEKKFSGRSRLYVGNIAPEVTEEEIQEMFKSYGEINELFVNKEKNFCFVRLDYHTNAERAKRELDSTVLKGRTLKIRFAPPFSAIKIKNLTPFVSNELLHCAFSVFGEIERCYVMVDDRGKSTGEGIIEYARKNSAALALRKCNDGCFFLTASLRPVIVEQFDIVDNSDGYPEKNIPRKNVDYMKDREVGPRFANSSSFEHEYGLRWKQLYEMFAQKEQALKKELEMDKEKLEAQMEFARYEHETEMLREQLRAREMDRDRQKREWEMKERQADEARQRNEEQMRRQQEEMQQRMLHQEEELRRRQEENSLFMQAHQLDNLLTQQEHAFEQPEPRRMFNNSLSPDNMGQNESMDSKPFMNTFERNPRFEGLRDMGGGQHGGPRSGGNMGGRGHWVNENRGGMRGGNRDDFPPKRRRY